ncbi:hypothetical protein TrST_g12055 [Triparma strigata]|uniref:Uncharacterized protein n=1 Tax=Triparma strigata TaxID=1606541 RepID=A0A9W7EBH3_9STRA|nr:hypothetical protein TrST_g12055 [Triparma strigata]
MKAKLDGSELKREQAEKRFEHMLAMICANWSEDEANDRKLNIESEVLIEQLGVSLEDLDPKHADAKSKNEALKQLMKQREEESSGLGKEINFLWEYLKKSEDERKALNKKVEVAGKIKQAGVSLLTEERDRLADLASEKLLEELTIKVDDLDPKPKDVVSKYKALKELKKKREEESSGLEKEISVDRGDRDTSVGQKKSETQMQTDADATAPKNDDEESKEKVRVRKQAAKSIGGGSRSAKKRDEKA